MLRPGDAPVYFGPAAHPQHTKAAIHESCSARTQLQLQGSMHWVESAGCVRLSTGLVRQLGTDEHSEQNKGAQQATVACSAVIDPAPGSKHRTQLNLFCSPTGATAVYRMPVIC